MNRAQWWTFDRPVTKDPLMWAAIAIGVVAAILAVTRADGPTSSALGGYLLVVGFATGWFATGVVGGSVRNLARGYRGDGRSAVDDR